MTSLLSEQDTGKTLSSGLREVNFPNDFASATYLQAEIKTLMYGNATSAVLVRTSTSQEQENNTESSKSLQLNNDESRNHIQQSESNHSGSSETTLRLNELQQRVARLESLIAQ